MIAVAAAKESMSRLSANAGEKRRKIVGNLVGKQVRKKFGKDYFKGDVVSYDSENDNYRVVFEDSDYGDYDQKEIERIIVEYDD